MKKVIFLDIDGVLQPIRSQERFKHDIRALQKQLAEELNSDLATTTCFDVGAVYYDWDKQAVDYLLRLCRDYGVSIVISSSWRWWQTYPQLIALFQIHQLHQYIIDITGENKGNGQIDASRTLEIQDYLDAHPEIEKFVIFDDIDFFGMKKRFPEQFILCKKKLEEEHFLRAVQIFSDKT